MGSLVEVARRAGVSVTTASRVVNNSTHPVSEATRARVLEAMRSLNYRPNALARAMITQRTRIIGVLIGDSSDPYFSPIVRGIEDVARAAGYLVIICNTDRHPEIEYSYLTLLRDYQVDGLIFGGGSHHDETALRQISGALTDLRDRGAGIVALNPHVFPAPQVSIDNTAAAALMTDYLLGQGHRRIAFVNGPASLTTSHSRFAGFRQALESAGIAIESDLVWPGDFTFESGLDVAHRVGTCQPSPTAIFAANDQMAIGVLVGLQRMGIPVPSSVSVAGFDDIPAAEYTQPALTTVRVPMYQLGATGMQTLLAMLRGEQVNPVMHLPHTLVIRSSTAAPVETGLKG